MVKHSRLTASLKNPVLRRMQSLARALGLRGANSSPYDDMMHSCHNAMKEDANFQENTPKDRSGIPAEFLLDGLYRLRKGDAVLSGQYALEQTLLVPPSALIEPQRSPLAIVEYMTGRRMTV